MRTGLSKLTVHAFLIIICGFNTSLTDVQPDDVDQEQFDNLEEYRYASTLCARECLQNERPRTCHYKWHLEPYAVLGGACGLCPAIKADCFKPQCVSADGYERAILSVNRRLPGPSIQVCKGDTIVVDIKNQLPGGSTSIHWHGIRQRLTPWMDGVPMVTQCPVMEGQTFRYRFLADESGTYFWHSHDGLQKLDGVVGSLIVREPAHADPLRPFYDYDLPSHTVLVQDWIHTTALDRLPGHLRKNSGQVPDTYLINGKGIYLKSLFEFYGGAFKTPLAEFSVRKGYRYRFRIISGTCLSCPFHISVQGHLMTVISIDGNPIEPVTVDSIILSSGERYDIVLHAKRPRAAYWMVVRGLGECRHAKQAALVQYKDRPIDKPLTPLWAALLGFHPGYVLNPRNSRCTDESLTDGICVSQLRGLVPNPPPLGSPPDFQVTLPFSFHFYDNQELFRSHSYHKYFVPILGSQVAGLMNNISNVMPSAPLLTQLFDVTPSSFCHGQPRPCDQTHEICECINLIKIPLGAVVEFVLVDTSPPSPVGLTHPFHIHGHDFYVVEQGKLRLPLVDHLEHLSARRRLGHPFSHLPTKDTVTVPANGYAVLRVLADNPGFWLFHCHFAYHLATGMSVIVQVGEFEDIPSPPPMFPRCNEYLPYDSDLDYL